jgi:5'-nucleotidase
MFEPIRDLAGARILVTNDDGIDAPGLKVLERVAKDLGGDVWVVAPESEQSSVAHSLTVRRPLRIRQVSRRRFAIDGTPSDCVLLAIRQIMGASRPQLLLSGVNPGSNMGEDVTYSGTVAAAMEGTLLGVPSIALSQESNRKDAVRWSTVEHWAERVIRAVVAVGWPKNVLINVNFPNRPHGLVQGIQVARQGKRLDPDPLTERVDPRGQTYYWIGGQRGDDAGQPGTDLEAIAQGKVAVTPLCVDFTDRTAMDRLAEALG